MSDRTHADTPMTSDMSLAEIEAEIATFPPPGSPAWHGLADNSRYRCEALIAWLPIAQAAEARAKEKAEHVALLADLAAATERAERAEREATAAEDWKLEVAAAKAQLAAAREALTAYGEHKPSCDEVLYSGRVVCSCGFAAALAASAPDTGDYKSVLIQLA